MATGDDLLVFLYDDKGTPYGMFTVLDGVQQYFFYLYNAQGDVIAIIDDYAERVVNYEYSAWGELLSVTGSKADTVGTLNPFRYRGYCYDTETGLYYLNSRYYDPVTQRFVNGDGAISGVGNSIQGYNLFAYCFNNPICMDDSNGNWPNYSDYVKTNGMPIISSVLSFINKIIENHRDNLKIDANSETTTKDKIVNDQNGDTGKNFEYGLYKASWNACETIAVHNAKVLKGIPSSLSETMQDFQRAGAMIGYGFFGSSPYRIGRVLETEAIDYSRVKIGNMTNPGVYIISFWNESIFDGLHTIAINYDGATYTAYNLYGDGKTYAIQLSEYNKRFICGYYLGV